MTISGRQDTTYCREAATQVGRNRPGRIANAGSQGMRRRGASATDRCHPLSILQVEHLPHSTGVQRSFKGVPVNSRGSSSRRRMCRGRAWQQTPPSRSTHPNPRAQTTSPSLAIAADIPGTRSRSRSSSSSCSNSASAAGADRELGTSPLGQPERRRLTERSTEPQAR